MEEFRPASQKLGDGMGVKSLMQSTGLGMISGQVLVGQMYYSGYGVPNSMGWGEAPILPFVTTEDQKTAMAKASEAYAFLKRCPSLTLGSMLEEIAAILPGHEFASMSDIQSQQVLLQILARPWWKLQRIIREDTTIVVSKLFIGNPLRHLVKELHSREVSQGIDGPVDIKHICGIIVAKKKGKLGKEDKVAMIWKKKLQGLMILQPLSIGTFNTFNTHKLPEFVMLVVQLGM
ncbi:uncharacterized protein [Arachis hypogaea]|nr:uncharacterized protein LOC112777064 isoform X2 [Arachis hypogaea]